MSSSQPPDLKRHTVFARYLRALLGYLALAGLFYLPQLLGLRAFPDGDFNQHFLPFSLYLRSQVLAGRLPVWNPYTYSGHPFLADVQAAVYYPVADLLLGLTLPFGSALSRLYVLELEAALHLALAGFFTYLLVDRLTGRRAAAFLAGCVFAFSGYLTGYPPLQLAVLRTAIWLPLILWLLLRALTVRGLPGAFPWRWTVYAALAYAAAFLAGHSQTFLFLSYTVAGWVLLLVVRDVWTVRDGSASGTDTRGSRIGLRLRQVVLFYGLFLALTAAQLWPSLEFAAYSVRANVDYAFVSGGFPLQDTWQMLFPGVLTLYSPLYVGVVSLGLASLGIAAALWTRHNRAYVIFFALLALLALLVSYGGNGVLYPIFYRCLPGWNVFRGQERAAYLVSFALSILAGYGAATLEDGLSRGRLRAWAVAFAAIVFACAALFAWSWSNYWRTDIALADIGRLVGTALLLVALSVAVAWRWQGQSRAVWVLTALVLADLFLTNFATNIGPDTPAQVVKVRPEIRALQTAITAQGGENVGLPGRVQNEYRVYDDYGMAAGVEDTWGSSPLKLARYAALFDRFPIDRMWRLLGVQHVLTWQRTLPVPSQNLAQFPQAQDTTYLHHLQQLNPRAWIVHAARTTDDAEALRLLADHQFSLQENALVSPEAASVSAQDLGAPGSDTVSLQRLSPAHLLAKVHSERGGLLLVSENWLPGWQAVRRLTGQPGVQPVPVQRADLTLLAVPVPPGDSTVELAYRPLSVYLGLAITLAALLALLAARARPVKRQ